MSTMCSPTIAQPDRNVEQRIVNVQIDEDVRKLIDHLPAEQREVVIMRTYLGMSFKEIAEHTQVSINTSLGRMRYALINMRKLIAKHEMVLERA
jgi:RNA polymerase sigma-70 factor (ECF subfamily)